MQSRTSLAVNSLYPANFSAAISPRAIKSAATTVSAELKLVSASFFFDAKICAKIPDNSRQSIANRRARDSGVARQFIATLPSGAATMLLAFKNRITLCFEQIHAPLRFR